MDQEDYTAFLKNIHMMDFKTVFMILETIALLIVKNYKQTYFISNQLKEKKKLYNCIKLVYKNNIQIMFITRMMIKFMNS